MTPVFEVKMVPKSPTSSIKYIIVRVDDPVNIGDGDKCEDFLEKQFPFYQVDHVIQGYKQDDNPNTEA
jgi:hypothetical protein